MSKQHGICRFQQREKKKREQRLSKPPRGIFPRTDRRARNPLIRRPPTSSRDTRNSSTQRFSGTVELLEDGRARLRSTHGSCDGGRVTGEQVNIICNDLRVYVGPNGGTAYVPVRRYFERATSTCVEWAPAAPGGPQTCLRYLTESYSTVSMVSVPLTTTSAGL